MRRVGFVILSVIALCAPARATIMELSFIGEGMTNSPDIFGVVSYPAVVTTSFVYDTSLGSLSTQNPGQSLAGGLLSATLTANGISVALTGATESIISGFSDGFSYGYRTVHVTFSNGTTAANFDISAYSTLTAPPVFYLGIPNSLTQPFSYAANTRDPGLGSFQVSNDLGSTEGVFSVRITQAREITSPVPEPATWTLLALGFAAMGLGAVKARPRKPNQAFR